MRKKSPSMHTAQQDLEQELDALNLSLFKTVAQMADKLQQETNFLQEIVQNTRSSFADIVEYNLVQTHLPGIQEELDKYEQDFLWLVDTCGHAIQAMCSAIVSSPCMLSRVEPIVVKLTKVTQSHQALQQEIQAFQADIASHIQ